ncbi:MAG TPA: hypothetical protein VIP70_05295 [Nitrososphaeraceae archaeon]
METLENGVKTEVDKREILDLYHNQHKSIREIPKIKSKSVRDIVAILKEEKARRQNEEDNDRKEEQLKQQASISLPKPSNCFLKVKIL